MDITVTDNPDRNRYEAHVPSGEVAGFTAYRKSGELIVFTHTEVDPAHEGHGVGSALAGAALDDVRELGLNVVPLCPFIKAYIDGHPEYADLVRREDASTPE